MSTFRTFYLQKLKVKISRSRNQWGFRENVSLKWQKSIVVAVFKSEDMELSGRWRNSRFARIAEINRDGHPQNQGYRYKRALSKITVF
jgi:hypothetical protein